MQDEIQKQITRIGNPRKPRGKEGEMMLSRMNRDHLYLTEWALTFFDFSENDCVLDVGCGGGAALKIMSSNIKSGNLVGVDYSDVSVKMSIEMNMEDIDSGKMKIINASVEKLPFENNSFDKVLTVESFYFWPNPTENLKEIRRVLKTGGTFLLVADIYDREGMDPDILKTVKEFDLFNPTKEEFYTMFKNAGFNRIIIHTIENKNFICVEGIK